MNKKESKKLRRLLRKHRKLVQEEMAVKRATGQILEYDPAQPPHPENWLEYSEGERIQLVEEYHRKAGEPFGEDEGGENVHCALHAIVETQLAMEVPEVVAKYYPLVSRGVQRHEAIHELARDVSKSVYEALKRLPEQ